MKLSDIFKAGKPDNKYDTAVQMCCLIFCSAGIIVFFSLGLQYMKLWVWLLSFICCALGAAAYGTAAKIFITVIQKDLQDGKKVKAESVLKLSYLVIFSIASVIFLSAGIEGGTVKTWLLSFVGSYGGAVIYSAVVRLIIALIRKDP